MLGSVRCHQVESDSKGRMTGEALKSMVHKDRASGLIPFYVSFISLFFNLTTSLPCISGPVFTNILILRIVLFLEFS